MLILSVSHGGHDAAAVVADDYEILSAVQTERITRKKGDSQYAHLPTIGAALDAAGAKISDVRAVAVSCGAAPVNHFNFGAVRAALYKINARFKRRNAKKDMRRHLPRFNGAKYLRGIGAPSAKLYIYNHHFAHALSALFFTDWKSALLYTADGGGDTTNYSAYHFKGGAIEELDGDLWASKTRDNRPPANGVGSAYGEMTRALGYKKNRHEGKLTGLAAMGEPEIYGQLARRFWTDDNGFVHSDFTKVNRDMRGFMLKLSADVKPANAAASAQKLLEDIILKSIGAYLQKTGATKIGLAGGVFANVTLNRKIAELPQVEEVFICPAMGDEGIAVGGLHHYLLQRDGLEVWQSKRRRLTNVYWGGEYDAEVDKVFSGKTKKLDGAAAATAAELLAQNKIVALYCGRMEFGPRALGARSILAPAADKTINNTLNKRLARTEFMPFAPVVLAEDADDVFAVNDANRYAMRFMTITCMVREKWRDKIPAVVHVDGTARPQIIDGADNPLYADILRAYKQKTGLPVLINTSFNAHEEPIIHTPEECLRALLAGRVDYVAAKSGVYAKEDSE